MKTACAFYDGDWAGFLEVDLDLNLWTPYWWYNAGIVDRTAALLGDLESTEFLNRWVKAMKDNDAVIVPEAEKIKDECPYEYKLYQRLGINSVIAVPVKPRPVGFLAVRNPKRYGNRSSMLQMIAFVVLSMVNERKLQDRAKMVLSPAEIHDDKDIIIKLFGELEIYTSKGVLREKDFKSPKICRMFAYMLLNPRTTHPPLEIVDAIWPDDQSDPDARCNSLRGLIYRFRQAFSLISDYPLIESTPHGYRLSSDLHIMTDLAQFDKQWDAIQHSSSTPQKVELLKQAADTYRGDILGAASSEHWLVNTSIHYSLRYMGIINELLKRLAEAKDYVNTQHYAMKALKIQPGNLNAHYWLIYAMCQIGALEMAKSEVERARIDLTCDEFNELVCHLKELQFDSPLEFRTRDILV